MGFEKVRTSKNVAGCRETEFAARAKPSWRLLHDIVTQVYLTGDQYESIEARARGSWG